ncbi:hypothetical protein [Salipiger mucosus]|uniref:Uncharacterized protein n=1 Tax=Salipiger mucosus DSM 16094 TaxID=1123237 RepID=S9SI80_9RHOB|nr:hypothetical protein [Salipiger mucosus]EPX86039.1 hypothetical protein Salmuc_00856 [Salipiger mucosus DSM 16094]
MFPISTHQALPDVPRRLQHPYDNLPVLDWWKYDYDHVYVVLNPFFRVPGYSPETAAYGPVRLALPVSELEELLEEGVPLRDNEAPDGFEETIKGTGQPVRWADVAASIGAMDFPAFARTLWLSIIAGDPDEMDLDMLDRLDAYCRETALYTPEEDVLPPVLEPVLGRYLAGMGLDEVTLWSEGRESSRDCAVSAFGRDAPPVVLPGQKLSAISAPGMMLTWAYDDVAGLLALTDEMRQRIDPSEHFEGFWAAADTTSVVFAPEDAPAPERRN